MAFDMHDAAQRAAGDDAAHLHGRRPEAFVLADADGYAGRFAGGDCALRIGTGQRQRFFAEHGLAGMRDLHDLVGMQRVGRGEHNGLYFGIGQRLFQRG